LRPLLVTHTARTAAQANTSRARKSFYVVDCNPQRVASMAAADDEGLRGPLRRYGVTLVEDS
jgi:hypothetical protein